MLSFAVGIRSLASSGVSASDPAPDYDLTSVKAKSVIVAMFLSPLDSSHRRQTAPTRAQEQPAKHVVARADLTSILLGASPLQELRHHLFQPVGLDTASFLAIPTMSVAARSLQQARPATP